MSQRDGAGTGAGADTGRHVSGSTTWNIIHLVRSELGEPGVVALLRAAGEARTAAEIEDVTGWSSYEQTRRLLEATIEVLDDPDAAERVGTVTARADMTSEVVALLRSLGSPGELLRHIREAAAKFSAVVEMRPLEIGEQRGLVEARNTPGFPRYELFCQFTRGLLAQIPVPFELPPAAVRELECECRGDARCLFEVSWDPAAIEPTDPAVALAVIETRLRSLQDTVVDLVSAADVDELLQRITDRASTAVRAPRHVLAISLDGELHVASVGCSPAETDRIAAEIMTEAPGDEGGARLVVDVRTGHRHYGRLAALNQAGLRFFPAERLLLGTYAQLAAVALDAVTALDRSRREAARASALLHLARALSDAASVEGVCDTIADDLPDLIGCDAAAVSVMEGDELCVRALRGVDGDARQFLRSLRIHVDESESLRAMLAEPRPRVANRETAPSFVAGLMELAGAEHMAAVPIMGEGSVIGLITASFNEAIIPTADLVQRLEGVGGLAATALTKAQLVEHVHRQAMVDDLTGLPNRRLLEDRTVQALARWDRYQEPFALCFLDLDRFKHVNDELGHASGDEILVEAAHRLKTVVRTGDTVARFGGDEYVLVLPGVADEAGATGVATKVLEALQQPFWVGPSPIYVSASLGFAFAPVHGLDYTTLLKNADLAMYRSKRTTERWTVYRPEIRDHQPRRASLESELRHALDNDELVVYYQPQIDLRSGEIVAVEALVRWDKPGRGLVPPDQFIPLAEETGLVVALDTWVMERAAHQAATWNNAGHRLRVGVNLAGQTLLSPSLAGAVRGALDRSGLPAHRLELEVTERAVHEESRRLALAVEALEQTGARLAIDDFGTGHSGLSRLHQFPFDVVKIDRSFVADVSQEHQESPLLAAMITLAHQLHLDVVAEGVETETQIRFLRQHGCELAQGYLLGRPAPAGDLAELLLTAPILG